MILIGEAGGTKTDWRLLNGENITQFQSPGFNFKTYPIEPYLANLPEELTRLENLSQLYFYAAGVTPAADTSELVKRLQVITGAKKCEIFPDTLGVARALLDQQNGYVGLIGTGSGAAYYNGREITSRVPSLGYLIGDEGSGVDLGRNLLKAYLRDQLSDKNHLRFQKAFGSIHEKEVLENLYAQPRPGAYLAGFVPLIIELQHEPEINQIIERSLRHYFEAFFPSKQKNELHQFSFAGSVAHHLSSPLYRVAKDYHVTIHRIMQSPVAGLVLYHQKHG